MHLRRILGVRGTNGIVGARRATRTLGWTRGRHGGVKKVDFSFDDRVVGASYMDGTTQLWEVSRPDDSGDFRVCVSVLLKSARIYNFKGLYRGNRRLCSTI